MEGRTTIRVKKSTQNKLNKLRGYKGCITMDDVINYLFENGKRR